MLTRDLNQKTIRVKKNEFPYKINDAKTNSEGTYLVGSLTMTYQTLLSILGDEMEGDMDRTICNWTIEGEVDGENVVATIYDWKQRGLLKEQIIRWNIGGHSYKAKELISNLLNL